MNIGANERLSFGGDTRDEIASLEAQLEELADALARCRKFKLASQAAMSGGALWFVAALLGMVGFSPAEMLAAIAAVIGGVVTYGSNATTTAEVEAGMAEAEAKRAALIGTLNLRVVR